MNKILRSALVSAMVLFTSVAAFAQAVNDKIVFGDKVYQVISENLIANPGFDDGFIGWTGANDFSTQITSAGFEIQSEEGHGNYLVGTTNSGGGDAKSLGTAWAIEANKTYYYAFDVKSLRNESGTAEYLKSSLGNTKGDEASVLGMPKVTPGEWTTFEQVFTNSEPFAFAQVKFRWLAGNFGFDNFKLYEIEEYVSPVADQYAEILTLWQSVNTQNNRWDAEFEDKVVNASILGKMNEADKLLVKVSETNFDEASDNQNLADLAEARRLIGAAQTEAAQNYEVLKANKDAYEEVVGLIEELQTKLDEAKAEIANLPDVNKDTEIAAIQAKIDGLKDRVDASNENLEMVAKKEGYKEEISGISREIDALLDTAKADQEKIDADKAIAEKFPAGDYILYNVGAKAYLGGGNSWGTQASVIPNAQMFTLTTTVNGVYQLNSHQWESDVKHFLNPGLYVDAVSADWKISAGVDGNYVICNDNKYLASPANGLGAAALVDDATAASAQWQLIKINDYENENFDFTALIKAANFSRNHYAKGYNQNGQNVLDPAGYPWTIENASNYNLQGGANENMCAESYHSIFTLSQTIEGIPDGYYTLTAQAFYRQDGQDNENLPVLFANDRQKAFPVKDGTENNMEDASASFSSGYYTFSVEVKVTDGTLTVGVKNEKNTSVWAIWDNFTLKYKGDDATAYNQFVKDALYEALDKVQDKLDNFVEEQADNMNPAIQQAVEDIQNEINTERGKIDNATVDDEEEILGEIAAISEEIDNLVDKVTANQDAYDELMAAYNALKDKWQATYDRINAKYAGMVDNQEYVIKIYRGETLTEEEREQIGAYEKDGAYYVDAFITRDDFNAILKGLNKVDYVRNLDGYDDENDAIERSYAKGTCAENKENILAEIQKDLDAIDAVWNNARTKHDANVLNANNTNKRQIEKAYETNVAYYKDAINVVNGHLKEWHDAEFVQAANNALFDVYKAQEDAYKAANDEYTKVLEDNDEFIAQDLYPKAIFHYEDFAQTLDADVEGTCEGILATARAAAVAENAAIYVDELQKANDLITKIANVQAVVDTYAESVKNDYTANLNSLKQEIETYINDVLKPYDNDNDDPCIKEDQPTIEAAIDAFDDAIDQIAEDAEDAEEANEANETAFADIKGQIETVLNKLADDREIIQANNEEEEEPRAATAEKLEIDLMELLSEAEASYDAGTSVADKDDQLAELADLSDAVDVYFNNALLDVVNAKADAAAAYLAQVVETIKTYADAVKAIYLPKAEAIATEIAALKEAAKADWEDGELAETYEDYINQIGVRLDEVKGLRVAANTVNIEIAAGTNAWTDYEINGSVAGKAGSAKNPGTLVITVPAKTKSITFNAVAWKGEAGELTISAGETVVATGIAVDANENVAGQDKSFTLEGDFEKSVVFETAFAEATELTFSYSNKRFLIWDVVATLAAVNPVIDPEAQTIYQKIEELKQAAAAAQANEEAYAEIIAAIEGTEETETTPATKGVQDELDEAKEAIESSIVGEEFAERIAELEQQLNDLKEQAEEAYNNGEADDKKAEILRELEEISEAIEELLEELAGAESAAYRETLAADFDELKTYWNVSYAAADDEDLDELDRIYNEILGAYHETIEAADFVISKEVFDATEAKIEELTLAIQKATDLEGYLADNFVPGDPDGDGKVTVNDVTTIIDIILSDDFDNLTVEEFYTADTNGDGVINILDITTAINIILETVPEGNEAKTRAANNDYLVADGAELSLINALSYTTFQMDITVANGATLNNVELSDRAGDFQVMFSQISDNTYRVVVVSLQNRTIMGNNGLLLNLDITGDQTAEYSNVLFSDVNSRGYELPIISDATAIAAIQANVDADCQIYTLGGAQINSLQKGVNIVKYADGSTKKLFVK